jgi:hypothetical protein
MIFVLSPCIQLKHWLGVLLVPFFGAQPTMAQLLPFLSSAQPVGSRFSETMCQLQGLKVGVKKIRRERKGGIDYESGPL